MPYATLMVHLQVGLSNADVLAVTGYLAERFRCGVIGVAACRPIEVLCIDYAVPADLYREDRKQIDGQLKALEAEFRTALQGRSEWIEWRTETTVLPLSVCLAREARSADLLVVGVDRTVPTFDVTRHVDICDLVMQVGRPVLLVPKAATKDRFERVLVGWKATREAQRAIVDALPFLAHAEQVTVVGISTKAELAEMHAQLAQVADWLKHHRILAQCLAAASGGCPAEKLGAIADELDADLIVAGAYGHSRQQEWVLGDVTSDLVLHANRCSLLSH